MCWVLTVLAHELQGKVFQDTLTSPGYWPTTKLSKHPKRQPRTTPPSAVKFGTREAYHPISTLGFSHMENRPVLVWVARIKTSLQKSLSINCEPSRASIRRKPFGKKVPRSL